MKPIMKRVERRTEIQKTEIVKDKGHNSVSVGGGGCRKRRVGCANFQTACLRVSSTVVARPVEFCGNKLLVVGMVSLIKLNLCFPIQGTTQMKVG
jgi:hypothetical protein